MRFSDGITVVAVVIIIVISFITDHKITAQKEFQGPNFFWKKKMPPLDLTGGTVVGQFVPIAQESHCSILHSIPMLNALSAQTFAGNTKVLLRKCRPWT